MSQTEVPAASPTPPPQTGNALVDQALAEVADLSAVPLGEHHDRLVAVQDVLGGVLDASRNTVQTPIPGVLRPATVPSGGTSPQATRPGQDMRAQYRG